VQASSPTYGQWAVFAVAAPLVSAFQGDGGKESVLKVQSTGGTCHGEWEHRLLCTRLHLATDSRWCSRLRGGRQTHFQASSSPATTRRTAHAISEQLLTTCRGRVGRSRRRVLRRPHPICIRQSQGPQHIAAQERPHSLGESGRNRQASHC
jgi:hypothetical protein